jgi:hypothetical protein
MSEEEKPRGSSKYDFVKVRRDRRLPPPSPSPTSLFHVFLSKILLNLNLLASSLVCYQVRIRLEAPGGEEHSYVLSRFLISRLLTLIQLPAKKATAAALSLKKRLVDQDMLSITQQTLEHVLFEVLAEQGFGAEQYKER